MGVTAANVARMERIIGRVRAAGVPVVEQATWRTHSAKTELFTPRGVLEHHDASGSGIWGLLSYISFGADTAPLAQFVVSRTGAVAIVSAGRANHAGVGGPWQGIPADEGNRNLYGIEVANNGKGEPYATDCTTAIEALEAAILSELAALGAPIRMLGGHKEWTPRKIDPLIDMDWRRSRVAKLLAGTAPGSGIPNPPEADVPTPAEFVQYAANGVTAVLTQPSADGNIALKKLVEDAVRTVVTASPAPAPGAPGPLSEAEKEDIANRVIAKLGVLRFQA